MTFWSNLYSAGASRGVSIGAAGDGLVVSSSRFAADAERTRAYIDALARDIASQADRLSESWRAGWTDFVTRWGGFVATTLPESELGSAWYTMLGYADEARKWRASFEAAGGHSTATPDTAPRRPEVLAPPAPAKSSSPFVWALLAGVLVAGFLFMKSGSGGEE